MAEYSYDAEFAGIAYRISNSALGVEISVSGYNDKTPILLEKVLTAMRDLEVCEERFDIAKERLVQLFRNTGYQPPYCQVSTYTRCLSTERAWINENYLKELPHVMAEDIRRFYLQLLKQTHMEMLAHGNLYKKDARKMADMVESTLKARPLSPSQWPIRRSLIFQEGCNYV